MNIFEKLKQKNRKCDTIHSRNQFGMRERASVSLHELNRDLLCLRPSFCCVNVVWISRGDIRTYNWDSVTNFFRFSFIDCFPICIYYDLFSAWDRREIIIIHLSIFFVSPTFRSILSWRFLPYFIDPFLLPFPQSLLSRADTGACRWSSSLLSPPTLYIFFFSLSLWRPTTVVLIFFPHKRERTRKGKEKSFHMLFILFGLLLLYCCVCV